MFRSFILFAIISTSLIWRSYSQQPSPQQLCQGAQESCRECLLAHPDCGWCATNSTAPSIRCRLSGALADCEGVVQNPRSNISSTRNEEFSVIESYEQAEIENIQIIQLRPQEVRAQLRQNDPKVINITFRRVVDYPLDLYYVMDLSNSMRDDLETLQTLGISLASDIQQVTGNFRIGFGTFVDKPMMPYASTVPELLQDPCLRSENETCAPVFGFRHQLAITDRYEDFVREVNKTQISGNIDSPEGGFDALMQIAVCQDQIQWREDALRVIIFTTDASSHIAMDGKLAAILEANDMQCHLELEESTGAWRYTESELLDYPSIGQLKKVFKENNIQAIFAVTSEVRPLYLDLRTLLDATVPELNSDSSNVVEIIENQYNLLSSEIGLTLPTVPSNVNLRYRSYCPSTREGSGPFWNENALDCENVGIGDEVVFQFILTATSCPEDPNQVDTMEIISASSDRVRISIEYLSCECDCEQDREDNSTDCSRAGTLECGLCNCNPGHTGQECQCAALDNGEDLESQCVADPENFDRNTDDLCNNVGACECGVCSCEEGFFGPLCECSRTGCPNNCGGSEQGTCENCNGNPICRCHENRGYTLNSETMDCSCNRARCIGANSTEPCSGSERGECVCDRCECKSSYTGDFCHLCEHPDCIGIDDGCDGVELRVCAECVYEANRFSDQTVASVCGDVCLQRRIHFEYKDTLLDCDSCTSNCDKCSYLSSDRSIHIPQTCRTTHVETECDVNYRIFWNENRHVFVVWVLSHNEERDCPGPPDPLLIVLPVVGGIVLLGLLALILWKIFQTIRDKHEYEQFLEEAKKSQWKTNENPLFEKPTDRIENPAYIGAN